MSVKIKNIPKSERPRERLLEVGPSNLSNEEIISIILKTGTKNKNVKELSFDILNMCKDINDLSNLTISKLKSINGIGEVKALELIASIELGKRIFLNKSISKDKLITPKEIYEYTKKLFQDKKQEYFYCLYFDNKQKLLDTKLLFIGTINRSVVHPREIFKEAYLLSASNIICIHNHPSGDTNPSREDINFTRNIKEIGNMQGIPVVDHIIVSNDSYFSFLEHKNLFTI